MVEVFLSGNHHIASDNLDLRKEAIVGESINDQSRWDDTWCECLSWPGGQVGPQVIHDSIQLLPHQLLYTGHPVPRKGLAAAKLRAGNPAFSTQNTLIYRCSRPSTVTYARTSRSVGTRSLTRIFLNPSCSPFSPTR